MTPILGPTSRRPGNWWSIKPLYTPITKYPQQFYLLNTRILNTSYFHELLEHSSTTCRLANIWTPRFPGRSARVVHWGVHICAQGDVWYTWCSWSIATTPKAFCNLLGPVYFNIYVSRLRTGYINGCLQLSWMPGDHSTQSCLTGTLWEWNLCPHLRQDDEQYLLLTLPGFSTSLVITWT